MNRLEVRQGDAVAVKHLVRGHLSATLYLGGCLQMLPIEADAVISDPPYGMNLDTDNSRFSGGTAGNMAKRGNGIGTGGGAPIIGDAEPFDPSPWLDYPAVVLFGCNHYAARIKSNTRWR